MMRLERESFSNGIEPEKTYENQDTEVSALKTYLEEISSVPLLTPERESTLARSIQRSQMAFELLKKQYGKTPEERTKAPEAVRDFFDLNGHSLMFESSPFSQATRIEGGKIDDDLAKTAEFKPLSLLEHASAGIEDYSTLVKSNLRLVVSVARKSSTNTLTIMDKIQEGNTGLMEAAARFDYKLGYRFSTYATWWIKQRISRGIQNFDRSVRLPVHIHQDLKKINDSVNKFEVEGKEPTNEDVAQATGLATEKVKNLRFMPISVASLNEPVRHADGWSDELGELVLVSEENNPEEIAESVILAATIESTMDQVLTSREKTVLDMRFGRNGNTPRTLNEVGAEIGVTRERVRQIEAKALQKLKFRMLPSFFE